MKVETDDPIVVAMQERQRLLDEAREQADREFVAVVREELEQPQTNMVGVARRAGMSRENVYRLMKRYPEED